MTDETKMQTATGVEDLVDIANDGRFSHAVISYTVSEKDGNMSMRLIHCAFFADIPNYYDIVSLYMEYAKNMEKYQVTEEILETMFVRVETVDSLTELLGKAYVAPIADDEDKYGWTHGVAGNA